MLRTVPDMRDTANATSGRRDRSCPIEEETR